MPKLKQLSGKDVIKILKKFGFEVHSQKGSHIKLRRITVKGKESWAWHIFIDLLVS